MKLDLFKKKAKEYGLLNLSKRSGFSRSYIYKIMDGTTIPTLDKFEKIAGIIGYELILEQKMPAHSVVEVTSSVAQDGNWKIHYFNFVDTFRRTKDLRLISMPPNENLTDKEFSLISAIVNQLCLELNMNAPDWAQTSRAKLNLPWFVAGVENLKAMAIVESPMSFRRNNIFVLNNFLNRA